MLSVVVKNYREKARKRKDRKWNGLQLELARKGPLEKMIFELEEREG